MLHENEPKIHLPHVHLILQLSDVLIEFSANFFAKFDNPNFSEVRLNTFFDITAFSFMYVFINF